MCGRFTLHHSTEEVAERFAAQQVLFPLEARYNIAPGQAIPVVANSTLAGARWMEAMKWGLVPFWSKDPEIGNRLINARAETIAEKPAYKQALKRRRCILPSDGFYEWKALESGPRVPHHIRLRNGELFGFAGLWEEWEAPDGSPLRTCAIITVAPNELMAPIHNRMPAILRREEESAWLDPELKETDALVALLKSYSAEEMEAYPVSRRVNAPQNDDEFCIEAAPPEEEQARLF
jgi:putative SOS response-associated peptidase YedK